MRHYVSRRRAKRCFSTCMTGGIAALWLSDQQMKMLGHDGLSDHDKIVAPANLLQNFEKPRISKQSAAASAAE